MAAILVIDDDERIRSVFKRYLEANGHKVDCAADGRQGLRRIDEQAPDLVVTDIMMPEADGLEVVMGLRNRGSGVPVIAISGGMHAMPLDFLPIAKKLGARKVLYKPIELDILLAAVSEVLADAGRDGDDDACATD